MDNFLDYLPNDIKSKILNDFDQIFTQNNIKENFNEFIKDKSMDTIHISRIKQYLKNIIISDYEKMDMNRDFCKFCEKYNLDFADSCTFDVGKMLLHEFVEKVRKIT